MQNNIEKILANNPLIPVVTISSLDEIDSIANTLKERDVSCIEITLRTEIAWEAIRAFKSRYGDHFSVGVGTIKNSSDVAQCIEIGVDFMVSPGLTPVLATAFEESEIPFIAGVSTPSEIMCGMERGWQFFKFFPANLFGGLGALKAYGGLFPEVKFCPTGGINASNYSEYLELNNVLSVGGSWLLSK